MEGARKLKATPIGPYLFHLYMRQEALSGEEMVAYDIGLNLLKYDCTPELDLDQDQGSPTTQGAHRLIGLLEEHIQNLGDLVTKARIYDEAVAKTGSVTALKLIHIYVDYSAKMETILAKMRALFDAKNQFFRGSPVPLEKVSDLSEFPDLLPTEVL